MSEKYGKGKKENGRRNCDTVKSRHQAMKDCKNECDEKPTMDGKGKLCTFLLVPELLNLHLNWNEGLLLIPSKKKLNCSKSCSLMLIN